MHRTCTAEQSALRTCRALAVHCAPWASCQQVDDGSLMLCRSKLCVSCRGAEEPRSRGSEGQPRRFGRVGNGRILLCGGKLALVQ